MLSRGSRTPRSTTRCARVALAILVFFAVLPSVVPYDHLIPGMDREASPAAERVHESHCHIAPGSCANAPLAAGPGRLIFTQPLIVNPPLTETQLPVAAGALAGITPEPAAPPPRLFGA